VPVPSIGAGLIVGRARGQAPFSRRSMEYAKSSVEKGASPLAGRAEVFGDVFPWRGGMQVGRGLLQAVRKKNVDRPP